MKNTLYAMAASSAAAMVVILFSACNIEDEPPVATPEDFSSKISDYALNGEAGKTYTYITTSDYVDTNAVSTITRDTTVVTVVNKNSLHPIGGKAIEFTQGALKNGSLQNPVTFYMTVSDSVLAVYQGTSSARTVLIKSPLEKGKRWLRTSATSFEMIVVNTGEKFTLPDGAKYATAQIEGSLVETTTVWVKSTKITYYMAQGIGSIKTEEKISTVYRGGKQATETRVTLLSSMK